MENIRSGIRNVHPHNTVDNRNARAYKTGMATVNQLIETILENIEGTKEGDLELRARMLREAGYLPTGKRGGGRGLAHVTSEHCANMIIGLLASTSARGVVQAVKQFRDLPLLATAAVDLVGLTVMEGEGAPVTLRLAIQYMINSWRAGQQPWADGLYLHRMVGYCDNPDGPVILSFKDSDKDDEGRELLWWLVYGARPDLPHGPQWAPMLSLDGVVIEHIVKLLGPIEDAAE